jgi:catechol 2,3-dioxygenase-like lactoylglutathione lyase family enzyme
MLADRRHPHQAQKAGEMTIVRVECISFGVEDIEACARFFADAGFETTEQAVSGASIRTPENQWIYLRRNDDPDLPPALEEGSTIREIVWGVDSPAALQSIYAELSKDRAVRVDAQGRLHTIDQTGFGIGFQVAKPEPVETTAKDYNLSTNVKRVNEPVTPYGRPRPIHISHVTLNVRDEGHEAAERFYAERLKFRVIDRVLDNGVFMQCEGDLEHHNLFLCHRPNKNGFNHIALEVRDFDEVIEGGNYMAERGWKESRRLGRHTLGSNAFRFFHAPCGGRIEFAADMDRMDKSFVTREWQKNPPHHLWMLKSPGMPE